MWIRNLSSSTCVSPCAVRTNNLLLQILTGRSSHCVNRKCSHFFMWNFFQLANSLFEPRTFPGHWAHTSEGGSPLDTLTSSGKCVSNVEHTLGFKPASAARPTQPILSVCATWTIPGPSTQISPPQHYYNSKALTSTIFSPSGAFFPGLTII